MSAKISAAEHRAIATQLAAAVFSADREARTSVEREEHVVEWAAGVALDLAEAVDKARAEDDIAHPSATRSATMAARDRAELIAFARGFPQAPTIEQTRKHMLAARGLGHHNTDELIAGLLAEGRLTREGDLLAVPRG